MKTIRLITALLACLFLATGSAIIRPGEVGVKSTLGNLKDKVYQPGTVGFNPFITQVNRIPTRTVNREIRAAYAQFATDDAETVAFITAWNAA